jgi:hypothetical protein
LSVFYLNGFGQTYTIHIDFTIPYEGCNSIEFYASYVGKQGNDIVFGIGSYNSSSYTKNNLPLISEIELSVAANNVCDMTGLPRDCYVSDSSTKRSISEIIKGNFLSAGGCGAYTEINNFKPNLTIQKSNPSTLEVCSGEMLDLYALPAGFPNVAYHWQYSLDNQATWIDVPAGFNDMTPNSNFSMQNILGINHIKHWGKTIHFRLGYDQNRPFTNAIAIKYLPCAPIVKSITCLGPKCSGENIQDLKVTFDRDLLQGERLENFAVIKTDSTLSTIQVPLINTFEGTDPLNKYFSIKNFTGLENGKIYSVKYQAFQDAKARGVIPTPETFPYNEISPLIFKATPIQPVCSYDTGGVTITAEGGTLPYSYILDGGSPITFKSPYELTGLSTVDHTIKVIDGNNCIEKTP